MFNRKKNPPNAFFGNRPLTTEPAKITNSVGSGPLSQPPQEKEVAVAETIRQIHNEFDSQVEILLAEAKNIIAGSVDTSKGKRLVEIGFVRTQEAESHKQLSIVKEQSERLAMAIQYYQVYFPEYKFINEESVKRICNKYGLVFGPARLFIGTVPEKNLAEIERFIKKRNDLNNKSATPGGVIEFHAPDNAYGYYSDDVTQIPKEQPKVEEMKICAPKKDFDTRTMYVPKGDYRLEDDPIVLQPVNEGYLIVTKWGIEGEDQSLVNEKMN